MFDRQSLANVTLKIRTKFHSNRLVRFRDILHTVSKNLVSRKTRLKFQNVIFSRVKKRKGRKYLLLRGHSLEESTQDSGTFHMYIYVSFTKDQHLLDGAVSSRSMCICSSAL